MTTPAARVAGLLAPARDTADAELVRRFVADRDGFAFGALVRRHGPMVFGVCRRVLRDWHLAEDAFQAAFLVLARRASAITPPGAVAGWLHGVAYRVAKDARRSALRRLGHERTLQDSGGLTSPGSPNLTDDADLREVIDGELRQLPAKYRELLVACDLEGRPRQPVAESLGIPEGTLSSRLTAARRMLADRLARRGVALALVAGVAAGSPGEACEVPRALLASAARIGSDAAGAVPAHVVALAQGAIRAMSIRTFLPAVAGVLIAVCAAVVLAVGAANESPRQSPTPPVPAAVVAGDEPVPAKAEPKPLTPRLTKLLVWRRRELVAIDPDGRNEKVVLKQKEGIHPYTFAMSPDGTKVAGVSAAKENPAQKGHLVVYDLGKDGGETDLGEAGTAHWSPDGKELAVSTFDDARKGEDVRVTHEIVTVATKKRTAVKLPADHLILGWSLDGRVFLTMKLIGGTTGPVFDIYLMNRDGTEHKRLNDAKAPGGYTRLSPDAKRVLCLQFKPKEETPAEKKARDDVGGRPPTVRELVVIDVASAKASPVADVPLNAEVMSFCWSPDGKRIAYTWRETHEGDRLDNAIKETTSTLVICDPDGKNQKAVLTETAKGAAEMTLVGVDWQFFVAEEKSDAEKLAGTWKIVSVTEGGKEDNTDTAVFVFEKDRIKVKGDAKDATYKLDPAKSPKWIDLITDGVTTRGIYQLDGDDLKICWNEDGDGKRPDKFVSERGTANAMLWILKREKP